jgi:lariat debranching enzyme
VTIDVLLICGDFQATRDEHDLDDMHCPPKYKDMRSFHSYFDGQKEAPYLTIFIGGNHESVNYLRKLYFGGWVAQNIYYLGQAGSIYLTKGAHRLRITGASGIYNHQSFQHHLSLEPTPLKGRNRITSYHTKQIDMFRLELLGRIAMMQQQ